MRTEIRYDFWFLKRKVKNEHKIEYIDLYVLSADDVSDCLLTEDYKVAYEIYKKMNKLTGIIYQ